MYRGRGKVLNSASMIEIQVGDNDVPHIPGIETQRPDLRHCRFFWTKLNIVEGKEEFGKTPVWMIDITRAKACIHQNQPRVAFDQKAMANQMAEWPIRRSEEHTSEIQSLMRISSAVFRLKKHNIHIVTTTTIQY